MPVRRKRCSHRAEVRGLAEADASLFALHTIACTVHQLAARCLAIAESPSSAWNRLGVGMRMPDERSYFAAAADSAIASARAMR
ncbi:MAG: hypothetical protein ABI605_00485 [Rhizobacter sp.]